MSKRKNQGRNENGSKVKRCTLYVDGMHCASCEVLLERKLLKQAGIESVDASLKGRKIEINYTGDTPDIKRLNTEFLEHGYRFSQKKFKIDDSPLISYKGNGLEINPRKMKNTLKSLLILTGLLIIFLLFEKLQFGKYVSVDSTSALPAFFILGLVAGISSCAALVGGLLLSMIKQWNENYIDADSSVEKAQPHILFHIGRITSFVILGGSLGLIGDAISLNNSTIFSILTIVVSGVMLILALQMLGVEWALKLKLSAPKSFTRVIANEEKFAGRYMPFGLGAVTFFLPCGFTLIAQTVALASGSFITGALIMLFFALGTFPVLLAISIGGLAFNAKPHLTARFNVVAGLMVLFFVLYNVNGQMNVLGLPSLSDIKFERNTSTDVVDPIGENGDTQVLNFIARGFEYIPEGGTTIRAGVPTTLVVDDQGIQGCGAFMAARGLIDGYVALRPGENRIDIGSPSAGTYKLTCSMGMVPPVTIKVI